MTEIEKMKRYIDNIPQTSSRYDADFVEMLALARTMTGIDALELAFNYGISGRISDERFAPTLIPHLVGTIFENRRNFCGGILVHISGRLISQNNLCAAGQSAGNGYSLPLSPGQFQHIPF